VHFGLYLVKHSAITSEQFVEALERQLESRTQLGALAIEKEMLTVKQVFHILRFQANMPEELFGEVAVHEGMLTEEKLSNLIYLQSVRVRPMAEIAVELGFITPYDLQQHHSEYRRDNQAVADSEASSTH